VEGLHLGIDSAAGTIGRHAGDADLDTDVAETLGHVLADAVDNFGDFGAAGVAVAVGGLAELAAEELIDGHAGLAAFDVPEGLVDAGDGVVQHGAVAPVGGVVAGLPGVVDAVGGLADEEGLQIAVDGFNDEVGALRIRGATVAVEAVLVSRYLDDAEPQAARGGGDEADVLDFGGGQTADGAGGAFLGGKVTGGQCGGGEAKQLTAVHCFSSSMRFKLSSCFCRRFSRAASITT